MHIVKWKLSALISQSTISGCNPSKQPTSTVLGLCM